MLIDLIMFVLVAAFVAVTALGHVLLVAAILQCVREDLTGRRQPASVEVETATADHGLKPLLVP
jgi:hypothetical protein